MNTSQSNSTRHPVPWLVTVSDLRRHLGRALDQCDRGRVVFFYYRPRSGAGKGRSLLVSLIPAGASNTSSTRPCAIFVQVDSGLHGSPSCRVNRTRVDVASVENRARRSAIRKARETYETT